VVEYRVLGPADVTIFRELRLRGLEDSPHAFGSTYEEDAALPLDLVADRLRATRQPTGRITIGAFMNGALVGVAACVQATHLKARHKADIYAMYVAPEARGQGIGSEVLARLVDEARAWPGVDRITLTVVESGAAARRLYAAAGFEEFGREIDGLRQNGTSQTVIYLSLDLRR
jgi:ribosomal protein S18 acetylase RimI-like enzyme